MNPILERKSVRKFTDRPVAKELLTEIVKGGMQAPSAHNTQPWEFLIIQERRSLDALAEVSPYAGPLKTAAAAIIVLGNTRTAEKTLPWLPQDLSACTENILLEIQRLGLGGVWLGHYPDEERIHKIRAYFHLPSHLVPFSVVAVGYEDGEAKARDNYKPQKIHFESY